MASLQHLPYLGTAEDDVLFVEWLLDEGAAVRRGQPVATVETLKAAFEVEADADGVLLRRLCAAGQRVAVQAPIAVLGAAGEACDDAVVAALGAAAAPAAVEAVPAAPSVGPEPFTPGDPGAAAGGPVAPAARRRAAELGVDLATVVGGGQGGLVRVQDVERAHGAAADVGGRVDPALLEFLRRDRAAFGRLPSARKLDLYRRHGARIGDGCHLGDGVVLDVGRLVLGDGAFFGAGTTVTAGELCAGALLHLGARCTVRCRKLSFGDNAFLTDDIEIGGGGATEPEAELVVGSHGFVGEHVHLNPCRRLRIGDEVVVSRGAVVMTHSFGPSWLLGYPSRFAGVDIGDGAQIGIGAVLFPGVTVGAGAVVLSGSSVVTAVPAGRLFGGVPAVDLKAAAQQLTPAEVAQRAAALVAEFARQLALRGFAVDVASAGDRTAVAVARDGAEHRLEFAPRAGFAPRPAAETVLVAVEFSDADWAAQPADVTAIGLAPPRIRGPIGPLAAAFREFLRKRGVRLRPRAWAYTGGWL